MFNLLAQLEPWIRALHIISAMFWMAGMMYLPRLYVYHWQAVKGGEMEKALIGQEQRLLKIIMTPAMISTLIFGLILISFRADQLAVISWLWLKLAAVFALFWLHGSLSQDRKRFAKGERPRSEKHYRLLNEIPAVLIIIIVIMAVVEPF